MCAKCQPARNLVDSIVENWSLDELCSAEKTREYYRRQGEKRERERIIKLLEQQDVCDFCEIIELIKGENK